MSRVSHVAVPFVVLAVSAHAVQAQSAGAPIAPQVRAELVTAREAVWRAYFQGDSAALVRILPERMAAMGRHRADIIRDALEFKKGGGKFVRIEFTDDEFYVNGNTAVVWSRYVVHLTDSGGNPELMKGRAIELFVKEAGRWINPHWHLDAEK